MSIKQQQLISSLSHPVSESQRLLFWQLGSVSVRQRRRLMLLRTNMKGKLALPRSNTKPNSRPPVKPSMLLKKLLGMQILQRTLRNHARKQTAVKLA
jgi:hypothetical protein